jgi:hypothetical protein
MVHNEENVILGGHMIQAPEKPHVIEEIEINATPEQIWAGLFDYDKLPEWSNGFLGTDKDMKLGEVSTAYFKNPITGGKMPFTHEVVVLEENKAFGWSGDVMLGRQDYHIYKIEAIDEKRSLFRQEDGLYGKPPSILSKLFEKMIRSAYKSFNKKLKARVEGVNS